MDIQEKSGRKRAEEKSEGQLTKPFSFCKNRLKFEGCLLKEVFAFNTCFVFH